MATKTAVKGGNAKTYAALKELYAGRKGDELIAIAVRDGLLMGEEAVLLSHWLPAKEKN
jgi:hypothetical protein